MALKTIVIVGTGWAGLTLARKLDGKKFNVTIISQEATSPYTPLPASAACGLFDLSLAEEPVRRKSQALRYIKASVDIIDFTKKICSCSPGFEIPYDYVVIAPGCTSQTFGTPGVMEHALFVKNVRDAITVR